MNKTNNDRPDIDRALGITRSALQAEIKILSQKYGVQYSQDLRSGGQARAIENMIRKIAKRFLPIIILSKNECITLNDLINTGIADKETKELLDKGDKSEDMCGLEIEKLPPEVFFKAFRLPPDLDSWKTREHLNPVCEILTAFAVINILRNVTPTLRAVAATPGPKDALTANFIAATEIFDHIIKNMERSPDLIPSIRKILKDREHDSTKPTF